MDNRVEYLANHVHQFIGPVVCESNLTRFLTQEVLILLDLLTKCDIESVGFEPC
jgi:hypothetical protein